MSTKILALITVVLLSAFVLAGCGSQAQAENEIEEAEKRIERRIEEAERQIEEAEKRIEKQIEEAERRAEEQAAEEPSESSAEGQAQGTEGEAPSAGEATLRIEGDPETEFSGSCAVGDQEGESIGGRVPQSFDYNLDGQKLECEIRNDSGGKMKVVLEAGNDRSVQRTNASGGIIRLTYSEGGISSTTISSSSSGGQTSSSSQSSQIMVN